MDGSCLCGAVTYEIMGDPELRLVCHCTQCQRQTGSAFSLLYAIPKDDLRITGALQVYAGKGDSGKTVNRTFCPECGSCMTAEAEIAPDVIFLFGGTMNDKARFAPEREIFCDSAQPWLNLDGLESFARLPAEAGV